MPEALEAFGESSVMYASDYPHTDSKFPHSVKAVRERGDLSDETKDRLLGANALRYYGAAAAATNRSDEPTRRDLRATESACRQRSLPETRRTVTKPIGCDESAERRGGDVDAHRDHRADRRRAVGELRRLLRVQAGEQRAAVVATELARERSVPARSTRGGHRAAGLDAQERASRPGR